MPAPKGNKYWEFRNKHGANHRYTPEGLWKEAVDYFEWMQTQVWNKKDPIKSGDLAGELIDIPTHKPMSIKSFCIFADIDDNTFARYEKGEGYQDFWEVTKKIKAIIESQMFEGAVVGAFNPNIIARTLGLTEKTDITTNGNEIKQVNVTELISGFMGKKEDKD